MIKDGKLYFGGNKLFFWFGNLFKKFSDYLIEKGRVRIITNPSPRLINPFTILISFTMDNEKYQVVIQGDFKTHYKESEDGIPKLKEDELFMIIEENKNLWFKKE